MEIQTLLYGFTGFWSMIITASLLGLSAGISPGPLLALVISETLRHNRREGIKVAFSPLITDLPVILVSLLFLSGFGHSQTALSVLSIAGGLFILYLAFECLITKKLVPDREKPAPASLRKGIIANLLNPQPYLFWITVGAPLVYKIRHSGVWAVAAFFISFYLCLVGSKVTVAILTERSKTFLHNNGYVWVMRFLGAGLLFFAVLFLLEGLKTFFS